MIDRQVLLSDLQDVLKTIESDLITRSDLADLPEVRDWDEELCLLLAPFEPLPPLNFWQRVQRRLAASLALLRQAASEFLLAGS